MKFKILVEDIEAVRKQFDKISDEDFDRLIALDPTFNPERNSVGTYGKWILMLFNKGKLDNEGHVRDILTRFNTSKKYLHNKDINSFKSLSDLEDYLNDDNSYKDATERQKLRDLQNRVRHADDDATQVFTSEHWSVYIPKTYEASCKLGQGTRWCTASTGNDYYYNHYTQQGPLYINIRDDGKKYQFHIPTEQYMDADDTSINLEDFFVENIELVEFYAKLDNGKSLQKVAAMVLRRKAVIEKYSDENENVFIYNSKTRDDFKWVANLVNEVHVVGLKTIPTNAFAHCTTITKFVFDEKLQQIDDHAFLNTGITEFIAPKNLVYIREGAFANNVYLKNVDLTAPEKLLCGDYLFRNCRHLETVKLSDNIRFIALGMFSNCSALSTVECTDGIYEIDTYAFLNCENLKTFNFPRWLSRIQQSAFTGSGLTSISLPADTTEIGHKAFSHCANLASVSLRRVETIESSAFAQCPSLKSIVIPEYVSTMGKNVFDGNKTAIKCQHKSRPAGWDKNWRPSTCTVQWGYEE